MPLTETFQRVKQASRRLALMTDEQRNRILNAVADAIMARQAELLAANSQDLAKMSKENPLYDRLQLTPERLEAIAADIRSVASLPSPLGHITNERTLPNGLQLHRISVPFGVIGMIYEARPNVTFDVFSLCFKSGNACILKGGRDADASNHAAVGLIHDVLQSHDVNTDVVTLLPATHEATAELLHAVGYVDLCIPRGGRKLIDFVHDNAWVPIIETGAGVVHCYIDRDADLRKAIPIVVNAKTRRVSVCNALDCLIIHRDRLDDLPALFEPLIQKGVTIELDEKVFPTSGKTDITQGKTVFPLMGKHIIPASEASFGTEFLSLRMAVKVVDSLDEAIEHIARYGSGHSESIVTENPETAQRFLAEVDAACVYWNAPTSFTDGAQFGLGAEIGISTQKLHARGPMALEEITTYKWIIKGDGQIRK